VRAMPKISLEPHDAPETLVYKYFYDKVIGSQPISYKGKPVPFQFSYNKEQAGQTKIVLAFVRPLLSTNLRHIGDDIKVKNLSTNNFERVTIGEPFEALWTLNVESESRDAVYYIFQQLRARFGRTGCIRSPLYIEHTRMPRYDHIGDNSLYKEETDMFMFIGKLGFRTYMRLSGGIPDPTYEPRPPIEEINLTMSTGDKILLEEVIDDGSQSS
jgi:hypothetical protein